MKDLSILVISCDKYHDMWPIFFELLFKKWPDIDCEIYLGTNTSEHFGVIEEMDKNIKLITIGEDKSWTENVKNMMLQINSNYVITFLEDFFVKNTIDNRLIENYYNYMKTDQSVGCFRLRPSPPATKKIAGINEFGIIKKSDAYNVTTQVAIWKKDVILKLLEKERSAWDFELYASLDRIKMDTVFLGVYNNVIDYHNGVIRGKWTNISYNYLKSMGINMDDSKRGFILSNSEKKFIARVKVEFLRWIYYYVKFKWQYFSVRYLGDLYFWK